MYIIVKTKIMNKVRVRFAPSPTGPLHIGGVRTALYNYLFAKKTGGDFLLRIEDTDQKRYTKGAEDYIIETLKWFGISPDEGPQTGGKFGPYRQSERKEKYAKYAEQLVSEGKAYYAFDTPEDLEKMREEYLEKGVHSVKYNFSTRGEMNNSLNISADELAAKKKAGVPMTIRLKLMKDEVVRFEDIVRGDVKFSTNELDDKIILKTDGMPTYHLANIIDDHLMEISHVIRGEEWLSSTAHHVLMYKFFDWEAPKFAHLPLILKPRGKGKLSKRDGAKFGMPVFPLSWDGGTEDSQYPGFREEGFLPEAVINFLSLLGWNPGNDEELFGIDRMTELFSLDKIVKSGARFDFEKAKWFNQHYIIHTDNEILVELVKPLLEENGVDVDKAYMTQFVKLMKERVVNLKEFYKDGKFFFEAPTVYEEKMIRKRFKLENVPGFKAIVDILKNIKNFEAKEIETKIKNYITDNELNFGEIFPILRLGLTGTMKGPDVFETIALLGRQESAERLEVGIERFRSMV